MPITSTDPRFVTKTLHAYLDYPVAVSLIALPFALGYLARPIHLPNGSPSSQAWRRSF